MIAREHATAGDAESVAAEATAKMMACLEEGRSFRLEAGAGAGKTHALVDALRWLVARKGAQLCRNRQKVACITFTNRAVAEIEDRLGPSEVVWLSTIHSFLASLIMPFQKALRSELVSDVQVVALLEKQQAELGSRRVRYDDSGRLRLADGEIYLSHDHILSLSARLIGKAKFRRVWSSQFPILLLDEYQDTDVGLMDAILSSMVGQEDGLQLGLFGDHWQKIYGRGCGLVDAPHIEYIPKGANFRSASVIVDALNRIRPELPQKVCRAKLASSEPSEILVFHTNDWPGQRGQGHSKGALLPDDQRRALAVARELLCQSGWSVSDAKTSVLRLTNRAVAQEQGFADLLGVFKYTDALLRREDPIIDFFASRVEPAAELIAQGRRTAALEALGWGKMRVTRQADKVAAQAWLDGFTSQREGGTIGAMIGHCEAQGLLSQPVARVLRKAREVDETAEATGSSAVRRWDALRKVTYAEVGRWYAYESGATMLATKHGVKGAEFAEVVVVFGGGWSKYDFPKMLAEWDKLSRTEKEEAAFLRARNLFYVTASRAKYRLALVFLKTLKPGALGRLANIFGQSAIAELPYGD